MRLQAVAMVRNEADVIEAFVRHNLRFVDRLVIADHHSRDGTSDILASLCAEGLPLEVEREPDPAFRQSEVITRLARKALARDAADFVFALDADEFLKVESRAALERALADIPAGTHALLHWLTYVPGSFESESFGPGHLWWRRAAEPAHALGKVVVARALLEHPDHCVVSGNHSIRTAAGQEALAHARLKREAVALAHCPVRSRVQLQCKVVLGYEAHLATQPDDRRLARHWRDLYRELRERGSFSEARLREIACNYGQPPDAWRPADEVELVEDPVALVSECRYGTGATTNLLREVDNLLAAGGSPAS
jgi:hypothetical protein